MLTYTRGFGEVISVPRVMWLLRGPTTVVVDTSVPRAGSAAEFIGEDFSRTPGQDPANALSAAGVDPHDVEFVVLTHLHWDHAGNCDLFPDATVLVQEAELRYAIAPGRFFRKSFLSPLGGWGVPPFVVQNLDVVRGTTEIASGLRVEPAPGHTPGSQAVIVASAEGTFAIGGDAVSMYENVEADIPPGFHTDVDQAVDSIDRLAATRRQPVAVARLRGVHRRPGDRDRPETPCQRPSTGGRAAWPVLDRERPLMLAVRKLVPGPGEPALVEVPIPEPGPGQVRVAVTATGICGTDIHLMRDEYRFYPPVTMGHEVAGRVDAVAS